MVKSYQSYDVFLRDWNNPEYHFQMETSGSTGYPKITALDREKLIYSAKTTAKAIPGIERMKMLCCLPTHKMGGFMQLVRAAVWNTTIEIIAPSTNPMLVLAKNHQFENISISPMQLSAILATENGVKQLMGFKVVLIGGAKMSDHLIAKANSIGFNGFYQTYGMTETYSHIALRQLPKLYFSFLPEVEFRTTAANVLEIKNTLTNNLWLNTGDVIELLAHGHFSVKGRIDHLINSGGLKFFAEQLEEAIADLINIDYFITGMQDELLGEKIALAVPQAIDIEPLNHRLGEKFGVYAKIRAMIIQPILKDTVTGKVRRVISS